MDVTSLAQPKYFLRYLGNFCPGCNAVKWGSAKPFREEVWSDAWMILQLVSLWIWQNVSGVCSDRYASMTSENSRLFARVCQEVPISSLNKFVLNCDFLDTGSAATSRRSKIKIWIHDLKKFEKHWSRHWQQPDNTQVAILTLMLQLEKTGSGAVCHLHSCGRLFGLVSFDWSEGYLTKESTYLLFFTRLFWWRPISTSLIHNTWCHSNIVAIYIKTSAIGLGTLRSNEFILGH